MCFQIALCLKAVWAGFNFHLPSISPCPPLLPPSSCPTPPPHVVAGVFVCRRAADCCLSGGRTSSLKYPGGGNDGGRLFRVRLSFFPVVP